MSAQSLLFKMLDKEKKKRSYVLHKMSLRFS